MMMKEFSPQLLFMSMIDICVIKMSAQLYHYLDIISLQSSNTLSKQYSQEYSKTSVRLWIRMQDDAESMGIWYGEGMSPLPPPHCGSGGHTDTKSPYSQQHPMLSLMPTREGSGREAPFPEFFFNFGSQNMYFRVFFSPSNENTMNEKNLSNQFF